jgi:D-serine deaminase-like pyridoxal phosphate-dependent protein
VTAPRTLDELSTPAAIVDVDRMTANLDRMAEYARLHGLALRPHTKTHKTPELALEQLRRGATGLTVATLREAEVMSAVADDLLIAYPPVGAARLERLFALPSHVRVTVALDSMEALTGLGSAARAASREVGVLVEADLGMGRVGVAMPEQVVQLARAVSALPPLRFRGLLFYPGHIRQRVAEQESALDELTCEVARFRQALESADLPPEVVSGGSTPTAFSTHRITGLTEFRPGTYIFNDRTTAAVDACTWEECAYSILATVVSTAVPGQAVVDAGAKALAKEEIRAPGISGFGALLDRPEIAVKALSEEHGLLDLSGTDWRPRVGDRVRVVPNHVCVSVNLQPRLWYVSGDEVQRTLPVAARGWTS